MNRAFANHGLYMQLSASRLAEFKSVENTYLSIFLVLGAFGLILGMGGLAIVAARGIYERKSETALMTALGYGFWQIFGLYFKEYFALMLTGLLGGAAAAFLSVVPGLLSPHTDLAAGFVVLLVFINLVAGALFIAAALYWQLRKISISRQLSEDI
jgi:ABC-type antimicrobial peptide transport system permease subunit